jgi:hypothetical protein
LFFLLDSICQAANSRGLQECEDAIVEVAQKAVATLVEMKQPGDKEVKMKDEQAAVHAATKVLDAWAKRRILSAEQHNELKEAVRQSSRQEQFHLLEKLEEYRREVRFCWPEERTLRWTKKKTHTERSGR